MTHSSKLIIYVFDDDYTNRINTYSAIATACEGEIIPFSLENEDPIEVINNGKSKEAPDIIIVDHFLYNLGKNKDLFPKGENLVPIIKNKWPKCPVICLTAAVDDCKESMYNNVFEDIFSYDTPLDLAHYLPLLVDGYSKLENIKDIASLLKLFDLPDENKNTFLQIIPDSIRNDLEIKKKLSEKNIHELYRWFHNIFFGQPGLLYNAKWTAMTLGIKEEAFEKYKEKTIEACYDGIWSNPNDIRWWNSKLLGIIFNTDAPIDASTQFMGNEFLEVCKGDISVCDFCEKDHPDTVALPDLAFGSNECFVHIQCSAISKEHTPRPFYEPIRIMRAKE